MAGVCVDRWGKYSYNEKMLEQFLKQPDFQWYYQISQSYNQLISSEMLGFDLSSVASLQRFQLEFEDLGKIGSGGFSSVSKVKNKRDKKIYALKTVRIKPSDMNQEIGDYLEKILGEAKILSTLRHPNILQYYGCWVSVDFKKQEQLIEQKQAEHERDDEQELELVIEEHSQESCGFQFERKSSSIEEKKNNKFINSINKNYSQGLTDNIFGIDFKKVKQIRVYLLSQLGEQSLQKYFNARNKLRKSFVQRRKMVMQNYKIILGIIQGLSYIHSQKVIHRDIKLHNIIINGKNQCKIIDFGLSKKVRNLKSLTLDKFYQSKPIDSPSDQEKHSSSVGTKIFSSPQQTNSQNYDYRTDIYSLAMVIGILFSQYKTQHQQALILLNLRSRKLDEFDIDLRLKNLLHRCLGQQKQRPDLKQLKICIKTLLKQQIQNNIQNIELPKREIAEIRAKEKRLSQNIYLSDRQIEIST